MAGIPSWVVPPAVLVRDLHAVTRALVYVVDPDDPPQLATVALAAGQYRAVDWVIGSTPAPVTHRAELEVTRALARAEMWVALCEAAHAPAPTAQDWRRLGVAPRAAVSGNAEWCHGAWRTLSWLLGVHDDPPVELPRRGPDGTLMQCEQRYAVRPDPQSAAWQAAAARRREQLRAEAVVVWRHVRQRADATARC